MNRAQFLEMRRRANEMYLRRRLGPSWSIEVHGGRAFVVGWQGDFRLSFPARLLLTDTPLRTLGLVP